MKEKLMHSFRPVKTLYKNTEFGTDQVATMRNKAKMR